MGFVHSQIDFSLFDAPFGSSRPISPTVDWKPIDLADRGMIWFNLDDDLGYVEPFTQRMELWDKYTNQIYAGDLPATSSTTPPPKQNATARATKAVEATTSVPKMTTNIPTRTPDRTEKVSMPTARAPDSTEKTPENVSESIPSSTGLPPEQIQILLNRLKSIRSQVDA